MGRQRKRWSHSISPQQHKKAAVTFYILSVEMVLKDSKMNKASSVFVYMCGLALKLLVTNGQRKSLFLHTMGLQ